MERWPRNLAGQSQLSRELARTPSIPSHGAEGGGERDAEDTSMASDGQLRSLKAQALAPTGLLGCLGTRSTMQMLRWLHRNQADSVKPSKELRLISLPDQS